jgi:hypothetical protein
MDRRGSIGDDICMSGILENFIKGLGGVREERMARSLPAQTEDFPCHPSQILNLN